MTDAVKSWIEERRAEAARARNFPDVLPGSPTGREASAARRAYNAKAGAMLPRALDALNAVLELHASDMLYENVGRCENYNEYHVDDFHTESEDGVEICMGMPTGTRVCRSCRVADEPVDWPCDTYRVIESALEAGQ